MGLFSSKTKHYVDTSVVRMVKDELIPNALTTALVDSLFGSNTITESVLEQAFNGSYRKFERMYRYAERGDYHYGLPNARVLNSADGDGLAKAAIESEVGGPVTMDYVYYRPLNNTHAAWKLLYDTAQYTASNNELTAVTASIGFTTYLEKIVAVHGYASGREPEQSAIGVWGDNPSAGVTPAQPDWSAPGALASLVITQETQHILGGNEAAEIHYIWVDGAGVTQRAFYTLNLSSYDTDQEYYQARYTYLGNVAYWIYDPLTGPHTALNAVFSPVDVISPGTYFPFAVFRSEGANRATNALSTTPEYLTTEKLLEYLGIDYREMSDGMHADAGINNVDQAVMMMGVPIDAQSESEMDYLFRYFNDLYDSLPALAQSRIDHSVLPDLNSQFGQSAGAARTSYALEVSDADFTSTLSFDAIENKLKAGSIGPVGTLTNTTAVLSPLDIRFSTSGVPTGVVAEAARILRRQVTPSVYEEITVINPGLRFQIYRNKGAEAGIDDGRLLIPVDYNIARQVPILRREELYYKSLHVIFNSHVQQTTKWYEQGWFADLLMVIAVVLTVMTYGKSYKLLQAAWLLGAKAFAVALANVILTHVIIPVALGYAFKKLADEIGPEAAFWLAVAAAIAGGKKTVNNLQAGTGIGTSAINLLKAATGLAQGASAALGDLFEDLVKEQTAFELLAADKQELLDEANALLSTTANMSPNSFLYPEPLIILGEPIDAYYNRTVHIGNPGVEAMKISQNFINNSLRLPTLQETAGDLFNAV